MIGNWQWETYLGNYSSEILKTKSSTEGTLYWSPRQCDVIVNDVIVNDVIVKGPRVTWRRWWRHTCINNDMAAISKIDSPHVVHTFLYPIVDILLPFNKAFPCLWMDVKTNEAFPCQWMNGNVVYTLFVFWIKYFLQCNALEIKMCYDQEPKLATRRILFSSMQCIGNKNVLWPGTQTGYKTNMWPPRHAQCMYCSSPVLFTKESLRGNTNLA
jgi:hypothetical protein